MDISEWYGSDEDNDESMSAAIRMTGLRGGEAHVELCAAIAGLPAVLEALISASVTGSLDNESAALATAEENLLRLYREARALERITDQQYRDAARERAVEGKLEVDEDAPVSRSGADRSGEESLAPEDEEEGCYVQAWLWISAEEARELAKVK